MSANPHTPQPPAFGAKPAAPAKPSPWPLIIAALLVIATASGLTVLITRAAAKSVQYTQASPEELLKSAVGMIRNGEASRLVELFYAETPEGRAIQARIGDLLGTMQNLGLAVAKRFPNDVAKLRDDAIKKATEATQTNAASIMAALQNRQPPNPFAGGRGQGGKGGGGAGGAQPSTPAGRDNFEDFAKALFADPFGWIEHNADRLTAVSVDDDHAAVQLDGKPISVGILLKNVNGRWYIDLPTEMKEIKQFLPQTHHEYSILGSLIKVLDNTIRELTDDVRNGAVSRVELLAEKAGEKAVGPVIMVFIVYGKEMDVRNRRERVMTEYRKRAETWITEREQLKVDLGIDWFTKLVQAMEKVTVEEVDLLVRQDSTRKSRDEPRAVPQFKDMDLPTFETTLEAWLGGRGAKTALAKPTRTDVDAIVKASLGTLKKGK